MYVVADTLDRAILTRSISDLTAIAYNILSIMSLLCQNVMYCVRSYAHRAVVIDNDSDVYAVGSHAWL